MTAPTVRASTLKEVNRIRQDNGYKPLRHLPKGTKEDPDDCVIQRSLRCLGRDIRVLSNCITVPKDSKAHEAMTIAFCTVGRRVKDHPALVRYPLPPAQQHFIRQFDGGLLPDLVDA